MAQPPNPQNVHAGSAAEDIKEKVGKEGARTIPGMSEGREALLQLPLTERSSKLMLTRATRAWRQLRHQEPKPWK